MLLSVDVKFETATMDGKMWETSEVIEIIKGMLEDLPHLEKCVVGFFTGALQTWERFTAEFAEGGIIDQATDYEKEIAWMPPTNDVNEGALGAMRIHMRMKHNTTVQLYNALARYRHNKTAAFSKQMLTSVEDKAFIMLKARELDASHAEKEKKKAIIVHKDNEVQEKERKKDERERKKAEREAHLNALDILKSEDDVHPKMLRKELEDQLDKYRKLVAGIPLKSKLTKNAERVECLKDAIMRYRENPDDRLASYSEEDIVTDEELDVEEL